MNQIEQRFYDAYEVLESSDDCPDEVMMGLYPQQIIGIYIVDFAIGNCAIEIDGHEYHKTKEQREHDYKRERYLIKNGYIPVRFMATEVFLDATKCVLEAFEIASQIEMAEVDSWRRGFDQGREQGGKKHR